MPSPPHMPPPPYTGTGTNKPASSSRSVPRSAPPYSKKCSPVTSGGSFVDTSAPYSYIPPSQLQAYRTQSERSPPAYNQAVLQHDHIMHATTPSPPSEVSSIPIPSASVLRMNRQSTSPLTSPGIPIPDPLYVKQVNASHPRRVALLQNLEVSVHPPEEQMGALDLSARKRKSDEFTNMTVIDDVNKQPRFEFNDIHNMPRTNGTYCQPHDDYDPMFKRDSISSNVSESGDGESTMSQPPAESVINFWDVDQVSQFIASVPGCAEYVEVSYRMGA